MQRLFREGKLNSKAGQRLNLGLAALGAGTIISSILAFEPLQVAGLATASVVGGATLGICGAHRWDVCSARRLMLVHSARVLRAEVLQARTMPTSTRMACQSLT